AHGDPLAIGRQGVMKGVEADGGAGRFDVDVNGGGFSALTLVWGDGLAWIVLRVRALPRLPGFVAVHLSVLVLILVVVLSGRPGGRGHGCAWRRRRCWQAESKGEGCGNALHDCLLPRPVAEPLILKVIAKPVPLRTSREQGTSEGPKRDSVAKRAAPRPSS